MSEDPTDFHSLRRLFRHSLDASDPERLQGAFLTLRSLLQAKAVGERDAMALLKLLLDKAVSDRNLGLLQNVLEHQPVGSWVARAASEAQRHNWSEGCQELNLYAEKSLGGVSQ